MIDEVWKDCKHYEGLYQVSNYGRVRSVKGNYKTQHDNGRGYLIVELWKHNKPKREYVHRLVAMAFIPNPENKPTVNHKDEDKQNNYVGNLEWMTFKENNNYGLHTEKATNTRREKGVYERQSQYWIEHNPSKENPKTRGNGSSAKKVICNNIIFDCIKDCAEYYDVNYSNMRKWVSAPETMPKRFVNMKLGYVC